MNASAKNELAEVAATQSAVDAMAVVTLSPEKYAAEVYQPFNERLAAAIEGVKAIDYDIKTTAGMAVAVKARATFRDLRTEADNERKERKAPITKIGKLLESHFDMVEERARPLESLFDADIQAEIERKEAEKAAKIAAERARTEAIQRDIQAIRDTVAGVGGKGSEVIGAAIDDVGKIIVTDARFAEFADDAIGALAETMQKLSIMRDDALASEAAALAAEEARQAEAKRAADEAAAVAAQRAENERIANEQAVERQRLAALAAAQEAEAARIREQAAANLKAEQEALAEQVRLQREAAAEQQRQLDERAAQIAADRAALARMQEEAAVRSIAAAKMEVAHAEALEINAQFDDAMARVAAIEPGKFTAESDLARCNATVASLLTDARTQPAFSDTQISDSLSAYAEVHPDESELTDDDITQWGAECGLDKPALIVRLRKYIADSEVAA